MSRQTHGSCSDTWLFYALFLWMILYNNFGKAKNSTGCPSSLSFGMGRCVTWLVAFKLEFLKEILNSIYYCTVTSAHSKLVLSPLQVTGQGSSLPGLARGPGCPHTEPGNECRRWRVSGLPGHGSLGPSLRGGGRCHGSPGAPARRSSRPPSGEGNAGLRAAMTRPPPPPHVSRGSSRTRLAPFFLLFSFFF